MDIDLGLKKSLDLIRKHESSNTVYIVQIMISYRRIKSKQVD